MIGIIAHGLHIGLVALGLVGLAALLLPQRRSRRPTAPAWHPPATEDEHVARVSQLRRQIAAGRLGVLAEAAPTAAYVAEPSPPSPLRRVAARPDTVLLAAAASLGAAGLHAEALHQHLADGLLVSLFFAVAVLGQAVWAWAALARSLDPTLARLGLLGNTVLILVWALSRTTGLGTLAPIQPPGLPDVLSVGMELLIVAICVLGLRPTTVRR